MEHTMLCSRGSRKYAVNRIAADFHFGYRAALHYRRPKSIGTE